MRWHCETFGDWRKRVSEWHDYFAWFPVYDNNARTFLWLETVSRRLADYFSYTGTYIWSYRRKTKKGQ